MAAFESALSGTWNLTANFTNSVLSTTIKHSGASSLHIVASAAGTGSGNAIYEDISPSLTVGASYTIKLLVLAKHKRRPLDGPIVVFAESGDREYCPVGCSRFWPQRRQTPPMPFQHVGRFPDTLD